VGDLGYEEIQHTAPRAVSLRMTSDGGASSHRKKENGELSRRRLFVVDLFGKRKTLFRLIHTSFRGTIEQVIPVVLLFKLGQFESQKKETNPG
jgi:hypothetical protein